MTSFYHKEIQKEKDEIEALKKGHNIVDNEDDNEDKDNKGNAVTDENDKIRIIDEIFTKFGGLEGHNICGLLWHTDNVRFFYEMKGKSSECLEWYVKKYGHTFHHK